MNYFNLVRVEYLLGYENGSLSSPLWTPMTYTKFTSFKAGNKVLLCRLVNYADKSAGIENKSFFSLPIYNHYFLLAPDDWLQNNTSPFVENALQETLKKMMKMQKQMNTLNEIPTEALGSADEGGAGPPLSDQQKDISPGQGAGAAGNMGGQAFTFGGNQGGANDPGPGGGGAGGFGGGGGY